MTARPFTGLGGSRVADRFELSGECELGFISVRYVATDTTPDVAQHLVETGMVAAWYPRGEPTPTRFTTYQKLEDAARASRTGLWARCETIGR